MKKLIAPEASKQKDTELMVPSYEDQDIKKKIDSNKRELAKYETKSQYLYPVERLAQDKLTILNVKYPGSDEDYPHVQDVLFRFVNKVYPNAKGGPLYVDEPRNEVQVHRAYERHEKMKKRKLRHVIMERDTDYSHLLEQLGEL